MKTINKSFLIDADHKKVFESFVNPEEIKKWLRAHSAVVVVCEKGPYSIGWDASNDGDFYCCSGKIKKVKKNKFLHIGELNYYCESKKSIGPIELMFSFNRKHKGTEICFKLIGSKKQTAYSKNFDAVFYSWEEAFYLLKKYLERKNV